MKIHPQADVQTTHIGADTTIWQFAVVLSGAEIGRNCNINCHTFVEGNVILGNNVTVKAGVYLWEGIVVEDNVFIGPNATFTNDKFPRSKQYPGQFQSTVLEKGCSIGANATILGGISIGRYAIVGAGSVVTKTVPAFALVQGNPARLVAWLDKQGNKLKPDSAGILKDTEGHSYSVAAGQLQKTDSPTA